jgi:hypothetical protein
MMTTIKQLEAVTGTLSNPGKMPCFAYSTPATACKTGQKMRKVKGSICSACYALKGNYMFPAVQEALNKRLNALVNPLWIDTIVELIYKKEKGGFFRWHDSGDIQSVEHLLNIMTVADRLPGIKFWLPTREYYMVQKAMKIRAIPDNLTIRLSALMFDQTVPPEVVQRLRLPTSGAVSKQKRKDDERHATCPAYQQDGKCGDCRACWDKTIDHITYPQH